MIYGKAHAPPRITWGVFFVLFRAWAGLVLLGLAGCAADPDSQALPRTLHYFFSSQKTGVLQQSLSPRYRYLYVTASFGGAFLLVEGAKESDPAGAVDVWYSADGEVLKLQHGQVVGTAGLPVDWRRVRWSALPDWSLLQKHPGQFERTRDQMPGYRDGFEERITVRRIDPPTKSALKDIDPATLVWFEERAVPVTPNQPFLPPARVAVRFQPGPEAVYGEQCLALDFCLTWQSWPVR
ncbi:MAG: YjbF family lipoprotein [Betaproteobacteria bacterium]|nr:YjbF family lipoprotein [Betaproteobacteria bacterium]